MVEIHIIPDNFIGKVKIIFNQTNGDEIEIKGDTIYFRINNNGILKTKFTSFQMGSFKSIYYYQSDLSKPIPVWENRNKIGISKIGVFNAGSGEENIDGKMELIEEYFVGDSALYKKIND